MRIRRLATYSAAVVALGGALAVPAAGAAPRHTSQPDLPSPSIGRIAYVTAGQAVKEATVQADGSTSAVTTIGPITKLKPKQSLQIFDFMASGDGQWIAWQEAVLKHISGGFLEVRTVLVLRQTSGAVYHLNTAQAPIGFAAHDQLVTSNADTTRRLDLQPTVHLIAVKDANFPLAAYSHGVIDTVSSLAPHGPSQTEKLDLKSFAGPRTVLHGYVLAPTNYRTPDAAWTSGDGKHVVVERGNHQDFGGLGPSSLADEFRLTGGHARSQLGHYGTNAAHWRLASVAYVGATDAVWVVWERATRTGATSVVAVHKDGTWAPISNHAIAVAGNTAGYVVIQPGKYVSVASGGGPEFKIVPTRHALLRHGSSTTVLNAEGTAFAWVELSL
jgi:hypothetical protein